MDLRTNATEPIILSKMTLANANSAQTVWYFFLLMLHKASPCKRFWLLCCCFFPIFIHLRQICVFFLVSIINLQVEHTLDKCYNEPYKVFFTIFHISYWHYFRTKIMLICPIWNFIFFVALFLNFKSLMYCSMVGLLDLLCTYLYEIQSFA